MCCYQILYGGNSALVTFTTNDSIGTAWFSHLGEFSFIAVDTMQWNILLQYTDVFVIIKKIKFWSNVYYKKRSTSVILHILWKSFQHAYFIFQWKTASRIYNNMYMGVDHHYELNLTANGDLKDIMECLKTITTKLFWCMLIFYFDFICQYSQISDKSLVILSESIGNSQMKQKSLIFKLVHLIY